MRRKVWLELMDKECSRRQDQQYAQRTSFRKEWVSDDVKGSKTKLKKLLSHVKRSEGGEDGGGGGSGGKRWPESVSRLARRGCGFRSAAAAMNKRMPCRPLFFWGLQVVRARRGAPARRPDASAPQELPRTRLLASGAGGAGVAGATLVQETCSCQI